MAYSSSIISTTPALAESALRALSDAQNKTYLETKKLGPNPSAAEVKAIRDRNFARANKLVSEEIRKRNNAYNKANRTMRQKNKEELVAELKMEPNRSGKPSTSTQAIPTVPKPESRKAQTTTGTVEGSDGAKKLEFDPSKKKQEPTVVDGIIQDR